MRLARNAPISRSGCFGEVWHAAGEGSPRLLFRSRFTGAGNFDRNPEWAPSPDGKQFIGMMNEANAATEPISVVLNWQAALGK